MLSQHQKDPAIARLKFTRWFEFFEYLSRFLETGTHLSLDSGGSLTSILFDLEISGFIHSYKPYNKNEGSKLIRYEIADYYIQFYYRFIAPIKKKKRWCRRNHAKIAKIIGFSAVKYDVGPYFSKTTPEGFQVDLLFSRADKVLTICEIKYSKTPASKSIIKKFDRKMEHFLISQRHTVERVQGRLQCWLCDRRGCGVFT